MANTLNEIAAIENTYGPVLFRMGLSHLADVGVRHMTDENIEEAIRQIIVEGEANQANGVVSVMTPEFQCGIVRCAGELAKFSIWDLFTYIKKYLPIDDPKTEHIYTVDIIETLRMSVDCPAGSPEEAEEIVRSEYKDGLHILGSEHFTGTEFNTSLKIATNLPRISGV